VGDTDNGGDHEVDRRHSVFRTSDVTARDSRPFSGGGGPLSVHYKRGGGSGDGGTDSSAHDLVAFETGGNKANAASAANDSTAQGGPRLLAPRSRHSSAARPTQFQVGSPTEEQQPLLVVSFTFCVFRVVNYCYFFPVLMCI
jgi:hypothetical protein